jgi:hypothetical protein
VKDSHEHCNFDWLQVQRNEKIRFCKTGVFAASGNNPMKYNQFPFTRHNNCFLDRMCGLANRSWKTVGGLKFALTVPYGWRMSRGGVAVRGLSLSGKGSYLVNNTRIAYDAANEHGTIACTAQKTVSKAFRRRARDCERELGSVSPRRLGNLRGFAEAKNRRFDTLISKS